MNTDELTKFAGFVLNINPDTRIRDAFAAWKNAVTPDSDGQFALSVMQTRIGCARLAFASADDDTQLDELLDGDYLAQMRYSRDAMDASVTVSEVRKSAAGGLIHPTRVILRSRIVPRGGPRPYSLPSWLDTKAYNHGIASAETVVMERLALEIPDFPDSRARPEDDPNSYPHSWCLGLAVGLRDVWAVYVSKRHEWMEDIG